MSLEFINSITSHEPLPKAGNNLRYADSTTHNTAKTSFAQTLNTKIQKTSSSVPENNSKQGNIINTGKPLDLAIQGQGYFVLSDGLQNTYTRAGAFTLDANHNLIDPATGHKVQRTGSIGVTEGFQSASNNNITIPYNTQIPAKATSMITLAGNLKADSSQNDTIKTNVTIYDTKGQPHNFSIELLRTNTPNTWDMLLTSASTNAKRINGIQFDADNGSFEAVESSAKTTKFDVTFPDQPTQNIEILMGTPGKFNGLTQFPGNSTVLARQLDGYQQGNLSTLSVNSQGVIAGHFSNGIEKNIAALQLALFTNNSEKPTITQAMTDNAGFIQSGALEKFDDDVETDFINMIQAQNSFKTNTGTIRTANNILREIGTFI